MGNPTELYLPLLTHADPDVRRHSVTLLLATYGERGLTYLRRLLDDPSPAVRTDARNALLAVSEVSDLNVELRPFRGVYVRCLGDFRIFINSYELQPGDWGSDDGGRAGGRKVQGLLAFLVHCGHQGATRAEIATAVWENSVSPVSISRTLGALRDTFTRFGSTDLTSQLLLINRERVVLNPSAYLSDADHFERTFDLACQRENEDDLSAAQPLYHQVIALYDGPYMERVPCGTDWGQDRRERIASAYLIAAERLAEHAYEHHSDRLCLAICQRALSLDPTDEDLTIWLLRAYIRQGLWVDAERAFRRYLEVNGLNPRDDPQNEVVHIYWHLQGKASLVAP